MTLRTLVWKELRARPAAMLSNSFAIMLGVAALVAIRHVTVHSEGEVSRQLSTLGANVLVLPREASLQDYYSADKSGYTLPEELVSEIYLAGLPGIEQLSPKLSVAAKLEGRPTTLTGILPQSEFQAKSAWQSASMFSPKKHDGCKKAKTGAHADDHSPASLASKRSIEQLKESEAVVGADVAEQAGLRPGESIELLGRSFQVLAVLPRTGTIDDSRVFAHLHTVQSLANAGENVSAIEIMACCEDASGDLVPKLRALLPTAKVVTISQVVETQVGVNRLMANTSWLVLGVLIVVGGASLAGTIMANVRERKREIGTLMAMGATPSFVLQMFLLKALVLGLIGGAVGAALGVGFAVFAGTQWAGAAIEPLPGLTLLAIAAAALVAVSAAIWPAQKAARLDPCLCFQEI